jgi:hypothetical protein
MERETKQFRSLRVGELFNIYLVGIDWVKVSPKQARSSLSMVPHEVKPDALVYPTGQIDFKVIIRYHATNQKNVI